mgnify:CR=1 FL=1
MQQINGESAQQLLFIHYIEILNKKSFISLTSICSDIQQKHPTITICSKG